MARAIDQPNFRSPAALQRQAQEIARILFERSPLNILIMTPDLRIVDANTAHLASVGRNLDELIGRNMFEAFPDSPYDPVPTGVRNLAASLRRVLGGTGADVMPLQRYDIRPNGGPWEIRYWEPRNWAVTDEGSTFALVHHVEDVTHRLIDRRGQIAKGYPYSTSLDDLSARAAAAIATSRRLVEETRRGVASAQSRTGRRPRE